MKVEGEAAKEFIAISLSSFDQINRGELLMADDETGTVTYKDTAESQKTVTLGAHAIRIIPKWPR